MPAPSLIVETVVKGYVLRSWMARHSWFYLVLPGIELSTRPDTTQFVRRIIHSYYTIFAVRVVDKYLIFQCRRGGQPIGLWKLNIRAEKTNRHLDIINIFKYRTRSWETILLISKTPSVLSNRRWTNTTGNWQCQSRRSHVSSLRIAELEVHT